MNIPKTDEEIWLECYCAALVRIDISPNDALSIADSVLSAFKDRFRSPSK